jgi:LysM repeat protein
MQSVRNMALVLLVVLFGSLLPGSAAAQNDMAYVARSSDTDAASLGAYRVQFGDTLASIAGKVGLSVSALMSANAIHDVDLIYIGQQLRLSDNAAAAGTIRYTIKRGDTLGNIAARYGTTAAAIARLNGLRNPNKIYIGMTLLVPSSGGATKPGTKPAAKPTTTGTRFVVSISQQHCWLYKGNTLVASWVCSTGRRGSPTAPGTWRIQSKLPRAYGGNWGFWMPYWMGIYWAGSLENGIHGIPYSASNGKQSWANRVGTPITYGCVMLNNKNVKTLYDMAYIGMPVIIVR